LKQGAGGESKVGEVGKRRRATKIKLKGEKHSPRFKSDPGACAYFQKEGNRVGKGLGGKQT